MANRLKPEKQKLIVRLLAEGNSLRSTSRITGCHLATVTRFIHDFGVASRNFLDDILQDLTLKHLQLDETWTFVLKKRGRLTESQKRTETHIGDQWLWSAIDRETKLIPSFLVGKRTLENACEFLCDLANRIVLPKPHASDDHAYVGRVPKVVLQISTDGLTAYRDAVDMAFGPYASHGVLIKDYEDEKSGRYAPPKMKATKRSIIRGSITERSICTSHIERWNGTTRQFMKRFTRLTYAFSKKLENLQSATAMFVNYYNFQWRTRYSDQSGQSGRKRPPAAMMAGVIDSMWSFDKWFNETMMYCE